MDHKQNLNVKKRRCEKEMPAIRTIAQQEEEDEEIMLPGFRFHPTDDELLTFYLRRKVDRKRLSIEIIKEVDIYQFDPWDLPRTSGGGENEWYYFCLRGRKYRNSSRPNRVTSSGFWKATGIDRPIYAPTGTVAGTTEGVCIGLKKSLVYYKGSAGKGTKTDWMMHEYRLPLDSANDDSTPSMQEAEVWTICRIFKRGNKYKRDPRNCREATSKKTSTDQYSSSNTSSLEFDGGDLYQIDNGDASNYVNSQYRVVEHPLSNYNYIDQTNQMNQGRWMNHPTVQNLAPVFHPNDLNPVVNEWNHKDSNWDELGMMMEYINQGMFHDYV